MRTTVSTSVSTGKPSRMDIEPGQYWRNKDSGNIYLVVDLESGYSAVNVSHG